MIIFNTVLFLSFKLTHWYLKKCLSGIHKIFENVFHAEKNPTTTTKNQQNLSHIYCKFIWMFFGLTAWNFSDHIFP